MDVTQFLDMMSRYGAPFVITAIVLYGAFRLMNIFLNKFEQTYSMKKEKELHDNLLEIRRSVDFTINTALERVLLKTNCDRVFIYELHNGGTNLSGLPFLKMTNTYEMIDLGVTPQKFKMADISLSMYSSMIAKITENPYLILNIHDKDLAISAMCYETLKVQGIHTSVLVRILDIHGRLIGYAGIDFMKEEKQLRGASDIEVIKGLAVELGVLLSVDDEVKRRNKTEERK